MIDGYVVCIGTHRGDSGDAAFRQLAENVMQLANTKGMACQGGISVTVIPGPPAPFWIVCQAMVLPKDKADA